MIHQVHTQKYSKQVQRDICTHMFVATLSIHSSQNVEATQVFIDREMDKQNVTDTLVEYASTLERREILTHATTRMNLKVVILREIS